MIERLQPFRKSITKKPNELRGCFAECRSTAKILSRESIDDDPDRTTCKITIGLEGTGITFAPGDRLAIMPKNGAKDVVKVLLTLGLEERYSEEVPLGESPEWAALARHMASVGRPGHEEKRPWLTVRDILTYGHISPLTREIVHSIHILLRASSSTVLKVLASESWPVHGSIGDLLRVAIAEVPRETWDKAFGLEDLSWLAKLVPVEVPRTYSIASYSLDPLPESVELTVSRSEHELSPLLRVKSDPETKRAGVASGFLNPHPSQEKGGKHGEVSILRVPPLKPTLHIDPLCDRFLSASLAPLTSNSLSRHPSRLACFAAALASLHSAASGPLASSMPVVDATSSFLGSNPAPSSSTRKSYAHMSIMGIWSSTWHSLVIIVGWCSTPSRGSCARRPWSQGIWMW